MTATATHCQATLVKDRATGLVDCAACGLHGRVGEHLPYSLAIAEGLTTDQAHEAARRQRRLTDRMLRDGTHTETVVPGPTKRQLATAAHAALLAAQMDPLFPWPPDPSDPVTPIAYATAPDVAVTPVLARIVGEQRLPHPNPHGCAHCTNRATLLLTLVTGDQIHLCRPHASRYPR